MGLGFRWREYLRMGGRGSMYVVDAGEDDFQDRQVAWDGGTSLIISPFVGSVLPGRLRIFIPWQNMEGDTLPVSGHAVFP